MYVILWRMIFSKDSLSTSKLKATPAPGFQRILMLTLTLPDGATRQVEEGTLPRDVVASIGSRLLRDALAVQVDGEVIDLITPLRKGGPFRVLTAKDETALDVLRHSGAHILATAVGASAPTQKSGSVRPSRMGFTTTSKSRSRSRRKISRRSRARCGRSWPRSFRSFAKR